MGYYVILHPGVLPFESYYVEKFEDLVKIEGITKDTIIYEGGPGAEPQRVEEAEEYKDLGKDWYRAGIRAQLAFARIARKAGYVLETLSQDQLTFQDYYRGIEKPVKRGDFLIRNLCNLEVEVKCRTFYGGKKQRYFCFSADDLCRHLNMQEATRTSVVVAVFRRKEDRPVSSSLCMISVDRIRELMPDLVSEEKTYGMVYRIPLHETLAGLELLRGYVLPQGESDNRWKEERMLFRRKVEMWRGEPYVLVGYYRNKEHLNWILSTGLYNVRMGMDRGALQLGLREAAVRYILLHTQGELITDKLYCIEEEGPRVFSRDLLSAKGYPGIPRHDFYLVYRISPVREVLLQGRSWNITGLSGYAGARRSAFPFTVPLSELKNSLPEEG